MIVPGRRHAPTAPAPGPRRGLRWRAARGHTLLELLAALAIVACLAALASASYTHFLVAARRFDARAALTGLAAAQERHFLRHSSYATRLAAAGEDTSGGGPGSDGEEAPDALAGWHQSPQAHYRLAIGGADADDYRLEARPRGAQSRDRECAVFVLERSGLRSARSTSGADTTRRCWAGA